MLGIALMLKDQSSHGCASIFIKGSNQGNSISFNMRGHRCFVGSCVSVCCLWAKFLPTVKHYLAIKSSKFLLMSLGCWGSPVFERNGSASRFLWQRSLTSKDSRQLEEIRDDHQWASAQKATTTPSEPEATHGLSTMQSFRAHLSSNWL